MGDSITKEPKEWVVMIYLAADNNLSAEGVWALTEIERAWDEYKQKIPDVGVVVLFDTNVPGVKTKVYEFIDSDAMSVQQKYGRITKRGIDLATWLGDDKVPDSASSPETLKAFVNKVGASYPANNYALILSGHGSGAIGDFLKSGKDNLSGVDYKGMSIPSLAQALADAKTEQGPIEIRLLGMDSCVMSMVEICYELPENVQWLIGAEGSTPLTGWPYYKILGLLLEMETQKLANIEVEEMAQGICEKYTQYYSDYYDAGISVDIASIDLSKQRKEKLRVAIYDLATYLLYGLNLPKVREAVILAHWRAQSYKFENYTDLWDFCNLLQVSLPDNEDIAKYCSAVKEAISEMAKSRYYGPAFQHSHGLSLYFPWRESWEILEAEKLKFSQDTRWVQFLKKYVDVTRREKRGEDMERSGQYLNQGVEFIPSSMTGTDKGISDIKLTPPYDKLTPPYDKLTPPYDKLTPPYDKLTPPYAKLTPPYDKGILGGESSMKNPPNGFLVYEKEGKDISDL